jgi:hypothetical protein
MAVDLVGIKEKIQTILENANVSSNSPRDLSYLMTTRVQKILKVNPNKIPAQASFYPFVTIFTDSKDIENKGIAKNQFTPKREAEIDFKIVGAIANFNLTDETEDPAEEDCEKLMENIEEILRDNHNLDSTVDWAWPTNVTYHNAQIDEDTHVRAAVMNFRVKIFYSGVAIN